MRRVLIILLSGLAAAMSSCIYSNFGDNFVVPEPGDPPTINAETNLDTLDWDIILTDSLEVTYAIQIENGEVYEVVAYLSYLQLYVSDSLNGEFWLHDDLWDVAGVDTLAIYIYYSTNSNSLGDIVGVEANVLDLKFPILVEDVSE